MAIFSKIIALSALAALAYARPLNIPRDVTSIVTETAWTTVDVPVTLWVDENGKPLSTVAEGGNFAVRPTESKLEMSALPSVTSPSSSAITTTTTTPAPASVVPTTTPAPPAPAPPTTTPPPAPVAAAVTSPQYQPLAASPTQAAAPAPQPSTNSGSPGQVTGSDSASCEGQGNACQGDITHWDGGLGACGWNVNTDSDMQVALPVGFMGSQSNGNPYCGKSLTIQNPNTGATVQATVGDKCMGCTGRSIDLTNALFNSIGGGCDGRCSGFDWWFN